MANIYRDVTLQNVSENDIGKQMKVSGWVENIRDHGGVSFIDLRDMYGVLQVVIREPELLKGREMRKLTILKFHQELLNLKLRRLQY